MKITIIKKTEVEVNRVYMIIPIRHDDRFPDELPGKQGETWAATINIDTGIIEDWKYHRPFELREKVVDMGVYRLLTPEGEVIARLEQEYVPNKLIPGEFGDYVELDISPDGKITNWPRNPSLQEFMGDDE